MSAGDVEIDSETSRIRAALVNTGRHSFSEAEEKLAASRLTIEVGDAAACTAAGQAAFLTATVTATRCFGRVEVEGSLDEPMLCPLPIEAKSLSDAARQFGANTESENEPAPRVLIGSGLATGNGLVQAYWDGWIAGCAPGRNPRTIGRGDCALAGVAAGALAVGQAFLAAQGDIRGGQFEQRLSLWSPETGDGGASGPGPLMNEIYLPKDLWLIGLGNLGQAYLWSLTMLPYPRPEDVMLFFQDDQLVGKENWGTSILVQRGKYGMLKTRVAEDWALARGFQVRRIDRRLDTNLLRSDAEPGIALAGLDGMPARCLLGHRGFEYIIDSGLGATVDGYRKFRMNVFDSARNPADHFQGVEDQNREVAQELLQLPAYQVIARSHSHSGCGAAMLADIAVAVPFVSAVVGALAITQAIRIATGEAHHIALTADTGELKSLRAVLGMRAERVTVGNVRAASSDIAGDLPLAVQD
ncbi:MAG: hypothetical protein WCE23_03290 [Candidatus Binatus sp.]